MGGGGVKQMMLPLKKINEVSFFFNFREELL